MTTVDFRPLTAADAPAVGDLYGGMDSADRQFRYLGPPPSDGDAAARRLASNDSVHGVVGAFIDGKLVGAANFVVLEHDMAEVALLVEHDVRRLGIGTDLLHELANLARERGVRRFVAEIAATNSRMFELLVDSDFPMAAERSGGIVRVALEL